MSYSSISSTTQSLAKQLPKGGTFAQSIRQQQRIIVTNRYILPPPIPSTSNSKLAVKPLSLSVLKLQLCFAFSLFATNFYSVTFSVMQFIKVFIVKKNLQR